MNNSEISYLYKYTKIDDNLYDSLEKHYLHFSTPDNFNDPFDCRLFLNWECEPEEVANWVKQFAGDKAEQLIE
jgi:hypothetical protein